MANGRSNRSRPDITEQPCQIMWMLFFEITATSEIMPIIHPQYGISSHWRNLNTMLISMERIARQDCCVLQIHYLIIFTSPLLRWLSHVDLYLWSGTERPCRIVAIIWPLFASSVSQNDPCVQNVYTRLVLCCILLWFAIDRFCPYPASLLNWQQGFYWLRLA